MLALADNGGDAAVHINGDELRKLITAGVVSIGLRTSIGRLARAALRGGDRLGEIGPKTQPICNPSGISYFATSAQAPIVRTTGA